MARSYLISKLFLNKVALTGWALSAIEKLIEDASAGLHGRFISKAKKSRSEAKTWREMFNKFKSVFFPVVTLTKLAVGGKTTHFFSCCFFFFTPRRNKKAIFCSLPSSSLFHFRNVFVSRVAAGEKKIEPKISEAGTRPEFWNHFWTDTNKNDSRADLARLIIAILIKIYIINLKNLKSVNLSKIQ